jgi:hypothetical protein
MRKFAIAGFVTVAMSLPFLGGTVESYASEGPWCRGAILLEAPRHRSKIAGFERLRSAALKSKAMVDPARRIRITTALSPKDGQPGLVGFIRGRGGKMRMGSAIDAEHARNLTCLQVARQLRTGVAVGAALLNQPLA